MATDMVLRYLLFCSFFSSSLVHLTLAAVTTPLQFSSGVVKPNFVADGTRKGLAATSPFFYLLFLASLRVFLQEFKSRQRK
jgi:hypothetical protein